MSWPERFAAHLIAYGPLVVLAWMAARRKVLAAPPYWIAGLAFLVSAPADIWALMLSGDETWIPSHFYPPLQLGLFAWAASERAVLFCWSALALAVATSFYLTPVTEPAWFVVAAGAVLVGVVALTEPSPLRPALVTYAVVGGLLYLGMVRHVDDYGAFLDWWWPYQGARLAAFGLFTRAAWKAA